MKFYKHPTKENKSPSGSKEQEQGQEQGQEQVPDDNVHPGPPGYFEATRLDRDVAVRNSSQSGEGLGGSGLSSGIARPQPRLTRPTNYLTLIREEFPIRGTYGIDPTLAIPPGAIVSKDRDGKELNLKFKSTNGLVEACVEIVRAILPPIHMGPARLEMVSIHCDVMATIHDRQQNRFRLTAISQNGNIIVNIPPTFTGSVVGKLNRGAIKFGKEIQAQLTILSEQNKESRYFIGDYLTTGYQTDELWLMDHLYVESHSLTGTVSIDFVKESSAPSGAVLAGSRALPTPRRSTKKKSCLRRLLN